MSEVLAQLKKKGGGESTEPIFGALVFAGSSNVNGCFGIRNGEMTYDTSGTFSDDYSISFSYTSSLHKLAAYSLNGGTYKWRKVLSNGTQSSGTAVVGAGQFICGQETGTNNFTCVFYKVSD